jgi:hypothetical protein
MGRVLFQGSRLSLLRALEVHAADDVLGLPKDLTAKQLYTNLTRALIYLPFMQL